MFGGTVWRNFVLVKEPSLESQLLGLTRELRTLRHRLAMLQARDSQNSRTLQAELEERIRGFEQQHSAVEAEVARRSAVQS